MAVLTTIQERLLDKYTPWAQKVGLASLIDEALSSSRLGIFISLTTTLDITSGRDLYVARNAFISGYLQVGGGYGSTGWTAFADGSTTYAATFTAGTVVMRQGSWFETNGLSSIYIDTTLAAEIIPCSKQSFKAGGTFAGTILIGRGVGYGYVSGSPTVLALEGLAGQMVYDTTAGPPAVRYMCIDPAVGAPVWMAV